MTEHAHFIDSIPELSSREGTKWSRFGRDVVPAWIADMDSRPCPAVASAIHEVLERGDLGYPRDDVETLVAEAFASRMSTAFGWNVDVSAVSVLSDVIQGLCVTVETMSDPGDGVVVHTPAYPPFLTEVEAMGRRVIPSPLILGPDGWTVDMDHLDRCCEGASILLLANPHNPTGRVFSDSELADIVEVATRHEMIVVSDEIHAEFVWEGTHRTIDSIPGAAERSITLTSPTKAFNLAGSRCAVAHIGSPKLRERWSTLHRSLLGQVSTFGAYAAIAAWEEGGPWLESTRSELLNRREEVGVFIETHLPTVGYVPPEGTYLAWLDLSSHGLDDPAEWLEREADLALGHGPDFGPEGIGWARLNFATGPTVLAECLERLRRGVSALDTMTH